MARKKAAKATTADDGAGDGDVAVEAVTQLIIDPIKLQRMEVDIVGETELICHNWSEKAKRAILDKQMGKKATKKDKKDPEADYEASFYRMPDGTPGFPASAFKSAIVSATRQVDGVTMVSLKTAVRVTGPEGGELVPIYGEPYMREDMVRVGMGTTDIRFRAAFREWETRIYVTFNAELLTPEMLINLINRAGMCGIGEWRPSAPKSSTGSYGCFKVKGNVDILAA